MGINEQKKLELEIELLRLYVLHAILQIADVLLN